jgi:SNF2 family DNA or RNA helicase
MNREDLHNYQEHCVTHILANPFSALFVDMGLGKTVSTLTAVDELLNIFCEISSTLIIAPLRVAQHTWTSEAKKWKHLQHLTFSLILGSEKERKAALRKKADMHIINRENVAWLVATLGGKWPFEMVVVDELSSFKSPDSVRFKSLRRVRPLIKRLVGLTGTPAPNGLMDLWSQVYLLDQGQRLGETLGGFRERYFFKPGELMSKYVIRKNCEERIYEKISDICISMKADDYLELPKRIDQDIVITMPQEIQKRYDDFEKEQILAIDDLEEISVVNATALINKLLQFANGAVYDDMKLFHEVHRLKIDALEDTLEAINDIKLCKTKLISVQPSTCRIFCKAAY